MSFPISSSAFPSMRFLLPPLESPSPTGTWRLNPNAKNIFFPHLRELQLLSAVPILGSAKGSLPALLGFSVCNLFPPTWLLALVMEV